MRVFLAFCCAWLFLFATPARAQSLYEKDVGFALDELEKQCGHFFETKGIDWKSVRKEFGVSAKSVKTDQEHFVLLTRLLARLEDGHASVTATEKTKGVKWPDEPESTGAGMFWCRSGKKVLLKTVWNEAKELGLAPGMEVVKVGGKPADKWLDARVAVLRDRFSFSTDQQALFYATHWGLALPKGTRLELELRRLDGKSKKCTLTYVKGNPTAWGPAVFPPDLKSTDDLNFGLLKSGRAYIQVRRCKDDLPKQMDEALATVGSADGLVLDFRGNSGGGFDHEDFMGRFVPKGEQLVGGATYESRGPSPYGGKIVVIVDGTVRSAGETGAGIFKEDGRAYMIGESPTAGMSSQKTSIELPSGLFALHVSTSSNKGRFNGGRGIEGIGVIPHEFVIFDAEDLAAGVDTLIRRADELLAKFPDGEVPFKAR
jgi:carboxyl-terminal processing protease